MAIILRLIRDHFSIFLQVVAKHRITTYITDRYSIFKELPNV